MVKFNLFLLFLLPSLSLAAKVSYKSLDPTSIPEHLAYYELYKETPEGKMALEHAWKLLSGNQQEVHPFGFPNNIVAFIALINPQEANENFEISDEALSSIEAIAKTLHNRKLLGSRVQREEELIALNDNEIDIGRAILLSQESDAKKIRLYEAMLDLMALQVLARCTSQSTPEVKVEKLNQLIFFELGFRFPPHSIYSQEIDTFTFLPQVLESRRGVCLGVSTLYLCLAQRLGLPFEIITPPGHIFVRVHETNIETTLRGVHIHNDEYLGINLKELPKRTPKEMVGMAFFNQATVYLAKGQFEKANSCYRRALPYMPNDEMLKTLYSATLILLDKPEEAKMVLKVPTSCQSISPDPLLADLEMGRASKESLTPYFLYVDETRASIEKKREELELALKKSPRFLSGQFQLAICWLQLQRPDKAIEALESYHKQDPNSITVEFFLAELYYSRYDGKNSWKHYKQAEKLALQQNYMPQTLKQFKTALTIRCASIAS